VCGSGGAIGIKGGAVSHATGQLLIELSRYVPDRRGERLRKPPQTAIVELVAEPQTLDMGRALRVGHPAAVNHEAGEVAFCSQRRYWPVADLSGVEDVDTEAVIADDGDNDAAADQSFADVCTFHIRSGSM